MKGIAVCNNRLGHTYRHSQTWIKTTHVEGPPLSNEHTEVLYVEWLVYEDHLWNTTNSHGPVSGCYKFDWSEYTFSTAVQANIRLYKIKFMYSYIIYMEAQGTKLPVSENE